MKHEKGASTGSLGNFQSRNPVTGYTQIRAQDLGWNGQTVSHPGAQNGGSKGHKTVANQDDSRGLADLGATCRLDRVKEIETSSQACKALFPVARTSLNLPWAPRGFSGQAGALVFNLIILAPF
jgi:hypothetical protein